MGSLTGSEILAILVVVLIVFGPRRLPELARTLGTLVRKSREALNAVTSELDREYGETLTPLRDVAAELDAARRDLRNAAESVIRDVEEVPRSLGGPRPGPTTPEAGEGGGSADPQATDDGS